MIGMKPAIVAGGGIAGIVSALLLARQGWQVTLIEREPECGGLLRSFRGECGTEFDYGPHILTDTGVPELDELLHGDLDPAHWERLPFLRSGHVFAGRLYGDSPFPRLANLPREDYERAVIEMLHRGAPDMEGCANCGEYLEAMFGPTIARRVFGPALEKFLGIGIDQLAPDAWRYFGLARVLAFDADLTREFKKSPLLDRKIGFHRSEGGTGSSAHYYPKRGGIGQWIELLLGKLRALGGELRTAASIRAIERQGGKAVAVTLEDGQRLPCDLLVWSINPALALKALGMDRKLGAIPMRRSRLFYYVFDRPFATDTFYAQCLDPGFRTFRVTLFSNFRSEERDIAACCVETMGAAEQTEAPSLAEIEGELKTMGFIDTSARVRSQTTATIREGFPVPTSGFYELAAELTGEVTAAAENIAVVGKAAGKSFFTNDTLIAAHRLLGGMRADS